LGELEISRVGSEETSGAGVGAGQADLRVDVEHAAGTAWRPDNGGAVSLVVLEVVTVDWADERVFSGALISLSREVVGALQGTSNTLLDAGVTTVIGRQDGVLEATRVQDVDVELAVLALLGDSDAGADGGNVGVEDEGQDAPVRRDLGANGALGAASSSIGDTADLDLSRGGSVTDHGSIQSGGDRSGEGKESKEPLHVDDVEN